MPAVGFDISDISMRFVELVETRSGLVVGKFGDEAIPRGVIEGGEIKKPQELRKVFTEVKKKYGLEFVAVSLPEEKTYLFELNLPIIDRGEIRNAIELQLEEYVPLSPLEAVFDYEVVRETPAGTEVSVVVFPRAIIEDYLGAFAGTGLTPVAFEMEAHAIARAVVPNGDMGTFMIVDFGRTRTGITVISGGIPRFTSTIPVGGGMLTAAVAKNLSISLEEAEKVKREKGIIAVEGNENLSLALISTVSILRDEVLRHHTYWETHDDTYGNKRPSIQKMYLCGGDSNLNGFVNFLADGVGVPVALANALANVNSLETYVPEISFNDSLRYATAFGLSLRRPK